MVKAHNRKCINKTRFAILLDHIKYADLILNGKPEKYLKTVTMNKPFEN